MNTGRQFSGGAGTYNAGLIAGGEGPGSPAEQDIVEEYNGTSWSEVGDLNETKYGLRGMGTSTEDCYMVGGRDPETVNMEAFDGSSWTETTNITTATANGAAAGTSTAGFYCCGYSPAGPNSVVNECYEWDGSSWTDGGDLNLARGRLGAVGVTTSALAFAGDGNPTADTESYNGTTWTEVATMNTGRRQVGSSCFDRSSDQALVFGGEGHPPGTDDAETEQWDGTAWTEVADLSTARAGGSGFGTTTNAVWGGGGPPFVATTEEWTIAQNVKVIAD